mmetsp:Transcript_31336/g.57133  ORF Transcript_31336/g.57133 Transcript_31336/m.57133 type:complete len:89 (-) Transcript_31336:92-358(-)
MVFVTYHLDVLHMLIGKPMFVDWRFLCEAAILGIAVQEALFRTGSLWPGVIMHWLWVWIGTNVSNTNWPDARPKLEETMLLYNLVQFV